MEGGMIYKLIGQAIGKIGAIGKDKKNDQQGFMYRGIDQVYNALNPVMAELGIFFCPEVIEQKREERVTQRGAILTYTLLTMRFTVYAPDGSNVSLTVVGEGMDSGDKSSNKAMSVAMKYAMFQLFCIPTEEMKDPDADVYTDILPRGRQPGQVTITTGTKVPSTAPAAQGKPQATAEKAPAQGKTLTEKLDAIHNPPEPPAPPAPQPETPGKYVLRKIGELRQKYGPAFDFLKLRGELIAAGAVRDIPSATMTMDDATTLVTAMTTAMDRRAS